MTSSFNKRGNICQYQHYHKHHCNKHDHVIAFTSLLTFPLLHNLNFYVLYYQRCVDDNYCNFGLYGFCLASELIYPS